MKATSSFLGLLLCAATLVGAAEEPAAGPNKLAALRAAKGEDGKPVISDAQKAYLDGLNDHIKALLTNVVETEIITRSDHLGSLLALGLRPQKMELLLQDNCILCHTDPEIHGPDTLFTLSPKPGTPSAHLNLRELVDDTHFRSGLSCAGCHGGDPANKKLEHDFVKEWSRSGRDKNRSWVPEFCGRCHSDPALIKQFNPALATDQLTKYKESPHGKMLLENKDSRAPDCVSCHGVHGILPAKNPLSKINPKRIPETCAGCHADATRMAGLTLPNGAPLPTNQLADYRASVHGKALLERGDLGAPACNSCHGSHASTPAGLVSVNPSCGSCHAGNASLFEGSKHKEAFAEHKWPECAQCHTSHTIAKPTDSWLEAGAENLWNKCHNQNAKNNPDCNATAAYFFASITRMDRALTDFGVTAEQLAMKGLDVDPIHEKLSELADSLKQSRSYIHSFSKNTFDQAASPGDKAIQSLIGLIEDAKREYRLRQLGLAASIALMGLVMLTLYVRLRSLER